MIVFGFDRSLGDFSSSEFVLKSSLFRVIRTGSLDLGQLSARCLKLTVSKVLRRNENLLGMKSTNLYVVQIMVTTGKYRTRLQSLWTCLYISNPSLGKEWISHVWKTRSPILNYPIIHYYNGLTTWSGRGLGLDFKRNNQTVWEFEPGSNFYSLLLLYRDHIPTKMSQ